MAKASPFEGVTVAEFMNGGKPSVAEFMNGGKPSCPSTFFGSPNVEVSTLGRPYEGTIIKYLGAAPPQGEIDNKSNVRVKMRILAEAEFNCFYVPGAAGFKGK